MLSLRIYRLTTVTGRLLCRVKTMSLTGRKMLARQEGSQQRAAAKKAADRGCITHLEGPGHRVNRQGRRGLVVRSLPWGPEAVGTGLVRTRPISGESCSGVNGRDFPGHMQGEGCWQRSWKVQGGQCLLCRDNDNDVNLPQGQWHHLLLGDQQDLQDLQQQQHQHIYSNSCVSATHATYLASTHSIQHGMHA